jgi:transposase InsO family protein
MIDCCTREIMGRHLPHRCRTEDALAPDEQAVLKSPPKGSREARLTLTTDKGTQFTSHGSWKRSGASASLISGWRIITRKATVTSNAFIAA